MENRGTLTQVLAVVGGLLVLGSGLSVLVGGLSMPLTLLPAVWLGAAVLSFAALRARTRLKLIVTGFGVTLAPLVLGLVFRGVNLGSAGTLRVVGTALMALYYAGLAVMVVGAILLLRDLFAHSDQKGPVRELSGSPGQHPNHDSPAATDSPAVGPAPKGRP